MNTEPTKKMRKVFKTETVENLLWLNDYFRQLRKEIFKSLGKRGFNIVTKERETEH
jgi:hypothetical protein